MVLEIIILINIEFMIILSVNSNKFVHLSVTISLPKAFKKDKQIYFKISEFLKYSIWIKFLQLL